MVAPAALGAEKAAGAAASPVFAAVAVARSVYAAHTAQIPLASPTYKIKNIDRQFIVYCVLVPIRSVLVWANFRKP